MQRNIALQISVCRSQLTRSAAQRTGLELKLRRTCNVPDSQLSYHSSESIHDACKLNDADDEDDDDDQI